MDNPNFSKLAYGSEERFDAMTVAAKGRHAAMRDFATGFSRAKGLVDQARATYAQAWSAYEAAQDADKVLDTLCPSPAELRSLAQILAVEPGEFSRGIPNHQADLLGQIAADNRQPITAGMLVSVP